MGRKRKQPEELYVITRDGELDSVVTDGDSAETIAELKQELARLIFSAKHRDEYGEEQLIEMWQIEGDNYEYSKLSPVESQDDESNDESNDESVSDDTDNEELDWTEKDYEDEDGKEYTGSELSDCLIKNPEKLIDDLNEQIDDFGPF